MYLISFCILLSQVLAWGKTYPWGLIPTAGRIIWIVLTLCLFIPVLNLVVGNLSLAISINKIEKTITQFLKNRSWLVFLVLLNLSFQFLNFMKFKSMGYHFPWLSILASIWMLFWIRVERSTSICLYNLALLFFSIIYYPIVGTRSDMLLVIQKGLELWTNGENPYQLVTFPWGQSGMPYFPGILFSHLPAWYLGLDLRWNLVLYRSLWMFLYFSNRDKESTKQTSYIGIIHFFILNPYWNFRHDLYFDFFFFLVALYFRFKQTRWIWIPSLMVTWQWSWPILPILGLNWLQEGCKKPSRSFAQLFVGTFIIVSLIGLALYTHTQWSEFFNRAILLDNLGTNESAYIKDFGFTLAPLIFKLGWSQYSRAFQAGLCLLLTFMYLRRSSSDTHAFENYSTCILILFVIFSNHFWQYFWFFPVIWMLWILRNYSHEKKAIAESVSRSTSN